MAGWFKRKAVEKSQSNIDIILNNLVPICEHLHEEIRASGGAPVTLPPVR